MDVYNAFSGLTSADVPPFLMSTVKEADARAAYSALMEFKDVVKANPITPAAVSAPSNAQIDAAAGKLSAAAYPFLKGIDWSSDLSLTPPGGGATPKAVLGAIDKALVMGAAMDGGALKEAALAHVKAIGSVDAGGVTTQADFAAINAGLGKAIASVPASKVMDVYNAFGKAVSADVPNYLIRTVNAGDAWAAEGELEFSRDWDELGLRLGLLGLSPGLAVGDAVGVAECGREDLWHLYSRLGVSAFGDLRAR